MVAQRRLPAIDGNTVSGSTLLGNIGGLGVGWEFVGSTLDAGSFGAVQDKVTDDTAAIQRGLNFLNSIGGGSLLLSSQPSIAGQVVIPQFTGLIGPRPGPYELPFQPTGRLATIYVPNSSQSPIVMASRDSWVQDLAVFYPNQVAPTAATPTVYPATISIPANSAGNKVRRCTFVNSYDGISVKGGRHSFEDMKIGAFHNPFIVDNCLDVNWFSRILCSSFWDNIASLPYPQNIDTWVAANQTVFTVSRADGMDMQSIFAFAGNIGMLLTDSASGNSYGFGSNVRFDTFTTGIAAQSTANPGWEFNNLGVGSSGPPITMPVGGAHTPKLHAYGGSFWGANKSPTNAASGLLDIQGVDGYASLGFYGTAPITQPVANLDNSNFSVQAGTAVNLNSRFGGTIGISQYTITDLVDALKGLGLIAP